MTSGVNKKIIHWGLLPERDILQLILNQLSIDRIVHVRPDKNYPTSINTEGFVEAMNKISKSLNIEHDLIFTEIDFEAIFKMNENTGKECIGNQIIKGKLVITKGGQAMVNGVILDREYFKRISGPENWRNEVQKLTGLQIELKADIFIHHSEPGEQSPEEGYIKYSGNIEYLNIILPYNYYDNE